MQPRPALPRTRDAGRNYRGSGAVMITIRLNDLKQYSDVLLSRSGHPFTVRFAEPSDAEALQAYFRSLSVRSRYNRFFGAISELPATLLQHFIHPGEDDR